MYQLSPQSEFNKGQAQWVEDVISGKVGLTPSTLEALENRSKILAGMAQYTRDRLVRYADESIEAEHAIFGTSHALKLISEIEEIGRQRLKVDETAIPSVRRYFERLENLDDV